MKARLLEKTAEGFREIALQSDEFLIGRGSDCDLTLHHTDVSRHHCLIHIRRDDVTASDLGSSNGTYLNGERIISQRTLRTGDALKIGAILFLVDLGDDTNWKPVHDFDEHAKTIHT